MLFRSDHVTGVKSGCQLRSDVGVESIAIHCAVEDPGRDEFVASEARDEGLGSPFAEWRFGVQALAAWAASPDRRHVRLHGCFVDEHQPRRLLTHGGLAMLLPITPSRFDVRASLLRGQERFFYM